jgi:CMP-N-acetylneuraminic acid synthetase
MNIVAFIFARGGSKGLPGKNIRLLGGKPLIVWSINHLLSVESIDRVLVSTDSVDIASVALQNGAEVPFIRPAELAGDTSPEWLAWRHALNYLRETTGALPDVMVSAPTTAPLRFTQDIENCLSEFNNSDADIVITITDAHRSPYFNMVLANEDGSVRLVNPPGVALARRQDVPIVYDMATVCYVVKPEFVMNHGSIFEGRVKSVYVPIERAIDIDTLLDFQIAEHLLTMRSLSNVNH